MAKGQKSQIVTKKHLARQQREAQQNRYILIVSIAIIVIVVGLIGYGIIQQYVIQPQQPVAKIADKVITTKQFQTYARYERVQWIQQYNYYTQLGQLFGNDPSSQGYIQQLQAQINYQLQPSNLGQSAIDFLVANQLIQQEADKRGITVSPAEVDSQLQEYLSYFPNGTPTALATSAPVPTSTLNPTQIALLPTATSTPTATATPTSTVTATITATQALASPTPTTVITPTATPGSSPTPSATFTPSPSPTPYTTQEYAKNFQKFTSNMKTAANLSEADLRWIFGMQILRTKVFNAITADISRQQDQVWARHIQTSDQAKAQSYYDRLNKGENFETLATEVYSGTASTADLGWFGKGKLDSSAENIVWDMSIGQISQPIQTANGWEIYQVLGHEVRTLSDSDFQTLKQNEFQKWIDAQKTAENAQIFDTWKTKVPTSPTIPPTQGQ